MKLTQKLLVVGAVATFASFTQAWAGGKEGSEPTPEVVEPAVLPDEEVVVDEEVLVDNDTPCEDGEGVLCDKTIDDVSTVRGGLTEKDEVVDIEDGGSAPPELQRGEDGAVNPEIYYTSALGGGPEAEPTVKVGPAFGSDERAGDIEAKAPRITAVKSQKKGPVALVKKGRVYLR